MAEEEDEDRGYKAELDVVIAEHNLSETYAAQLRSYDDGDLKLYFLRKRKTKAPYRCKNIPASLIKELEAAFKKWRKDGTL